MTKKVDCDGLYVITNIKRHFNPISHHVAEVLLHLEHHMKKFQDSGFFVFFCFGGTEV
jgi:hypothetical protein